MLKEISWQEYFVFLFVTLLLYYGFLLVFYYRFDFSSLRKANLKFWFRGKELQSEMSNNAQKVTQEIRSCFRDKMNMNELIFDLQNRLEPYKHWDEPDFRKSINDFIIEESKNKCSIHLSEEDLRVLWL
jgi:hypothetical protein